MNNKVSVVIRNKNEANSLEFLLKNLNNRYKEDVDEIIVIDNMSIDESVYISNKYGAKVVQIKKFSYGGSANLAAESASNKIIVIFSAHSFPVSHDFFKQIKSKFLINNNLAGLRCLHNINDYKNYINNISSKVDPNMSGLIFCGSAFNKEVWQLHRFRNDVQTMEDKEWSQRVINNGFEIEFSPSIFCYNLKRTKDQNFIRFKNEVIGSYQLWHVDYNYKWAIKAFLVSIFISFKVLIIDIYYSIKKFLFMINFLKNKPPKFENK